jgi:hypothetical protein
MKTGSFGIASGLLVGFASTASAAGKVSLIIADGSGTLVACKAEAVDANKKVVSAWPKMFSRATFDLAPGKYSFVCRLPGYVEGLIGPIDVRDGQPTLVQIKVAKIATQQSALKKPSVTGKSRWGIARAIAPRGGALQKPSGGVKQKPGDAAVPTGPTGKVSGKITAGGNLIPCRGMEVKAASGAVMPISWKLTSRYQLDLPAGDYSLTCTPAGSFATATVKATVQAGKGVTIDFTLQKK